jgi:hypothetical protein
MGLNSDCAQHYPLLSGNGIVVGPLPKCKERARNCVVGTTTVLTRSHILLALVENDQSFLALVFTG